MNRLGFYGFGNMATAIVSSWTTVPKTDISFYRRNPEKIDAIKNSLSISYKDPEDLIKTSDYLFLGFKPQHLSEVAEDLASFDLSATIIVSLLAGTTIKTLSTKLPNAKGYVRMMPNTSVAYQKGATGLFFGESITPPEKDYVTQLMSSTGFVLPVSEESLIDTVTGISGSGPAFIYVLANEILNLNEAYGLTQEERQSLVAHTLIGAGTTLLQSGKKPLQLIKDIASAKGTTQAGLDELEKLHFSESFSEGTKAAIKRAKELGAHS